MTSLRFGWKTQVMAAAVLGLLAGPIARAQAPAKKDRQKSVPKGTGLRGLGALDPGAAVPPAGQAPPPPAPSVAATGEVPARAEREDLPLPGEKEFVECKRFPPNKKVVVTLKPESELADLIAWIKSISCRPFIVPSSVRQAKVTVFVPEAITANEAYRIFLSALESMGLTIQPEGKVLKIIESNRARESSIPVIAPNRQAPQNEQFVTRLLRLQYVPPDEIMAVLNRLKGRDGDITPYAPGNTLIITDLASNIRRMEEVVKALDVPMGGEKIWIIRNLKNVIASEVAQMIQQIFGVGKSGPGTNVPRRTPVQMSSAAPAPAGGGGAPPSAALPSGATLSEGDLSISQVFPDDRTNSLILVATEAVYNRVLALIRRLEQQAGDMGTTGQVNVYPLENASAEDMAQVLSGLGASVSSTGGARRGGARGPSPSQPSPSGGGGGSGGIFHDEVKVTADKATNSLVIMANPNDYRTLRDVIKRLDLPRRQVFIEATVMEISLSKKRDLGVAYHGGYPVKLPGTDQETLLLGGLKTRDFTSLNPLGVAALSGLAAGMIGPVFNSTTVLGQAGQTIPSFGVLLQALQTNNDVNILQVPHVLTTDNEKATIQVGQNLPFPSAAFSGLPVGGAPGAPGGAAGLGIGTSVQRQDVALKLEITPHVNASDYVRLEIDNEISDVAAPNYNGLGPATNKRTLKTVAVVRDQQPIVLGGIMRDRVTEDVTKIPLLGDIPILGYLFKVRSKEVQKQMLLVVLTPYVIHEPSDLRKIFERKMQERREFIETYSAFSSERDFDKVVDYSRKRGALEEINQTAVEAEREAGELRAAEQMLRRDIEAGPVELPPQTLRWPMSPRYAPPAAPGSVSPASTVATPPRPSDDDPGR